MRVERFQDGDMDDVDFNFREDFIPNTNQVHSSVECFTFREKGKVISVAGFVELGQDVYSMWAYQTSYVSRLSYARTAKRLLVSFIEDYSPRIIYVAIASKRLCDIRWAKFLGFKYAYTMKDFYSTGEDLVGYSWAH